MVRCKNAPETTHASKPPQPKWIRFFENKGAEERHKQIKSRQIHQEKGFVFADKPDYGLPDTVMKIIRRHKWQTFARHDDSKAKDIKPINVSLVKEFYAHLEDPEQGVVYVRGDAIPFTPAAINKFYGLKDKEDNHTKFVDAMEDQSPDFLLEDLCFQET